MKKLVYLYIINYAKNRPEDAIMCVNSFLKDVKLGSPLIKALSIRTLGYLGVHELNVYLAEPVIKALSDEDSYVRKTAILTLIKLYRVSPTLFEERSIETILTGRLEIESNAYVLSNLI